MVEKYIPQPSQCDWSKIESEFRGCHFNYSSHFSVVLMDVADAGYRFVLVGVGNYGSKSDIGIFKNLYFD